MKYELEGRIIEMFDTQQVSEKFRKREFVVEQSENVGGQVYTEQIKFQLVQKACDLLDRVQVGDIVNVHFNIKGRRWESPEGKVNYFTNLDAWKLDFKQQKAVAPKESIDLSTYKPTAKEMAESKKAVENLDKEDDLPF